MQPLPAKWVTPRDCFVEEVTMGLMDVLRGMYYGPRGKPAPSAPRRGMSPLTMALLALLAYKAFKGGGPFARTAPANAPARQPGNAPVSSQASSGKLSDLLRGGLGGLLAGGAAGSILSGGLGELLKQFQQHGQGEVARSWIGTGSNKPIPPHDLASALGEDTLQALSEHTGMSRDEVLAELSKRLPETVDSLTPQGQIPSEQELSRMV
jgi:uncharacterized protein YidB (DUF937 family)